VSAIETTMEIEIFWPSEFQQFINKINAVCWGWTVDAFIVAETKLWDKKLKYNEHDISETHVKLKDK